MSKASYRYILLLLVTLLLHGQADSREPDPLFASNETLQVTIEAPFAELMRKRDEDQELPGSIRYIGSDGSPIELAVSVRTRGKFRALRDVCDFAPIRLNFKTSQTKETLFAKQDKLKLVTHCNPRSLIYEQAVIREYLTYRILNLLTDLSYRVRLLKITYSYSDSNRTIESYAFLIEDDRRLGKRIGQQPVSADELEITSLDKEYTNLASVFQFLIGNTDFSPVAAAEGLECCHNHTPYTPDDTVFFSIPYDFDQCGLVDAPHASPNRRFRLRSVRQRLYRGRCDNNEQLPATIELFRKKRTDIEALVANQEELSNKSRRSIASFLASFFKIIDSPRHIERQLVKKCI